MKTKLSFIFLVLGAIATGLALRASNQIRQAETQAATLADRQAELQRKISGDESHLATVEAANGDLEKKIATAQADLTTATKPVTPTRWRDPEAVIGNDPKKLAAYSNDFREAVGATQGGMFRKLGFTAEQKEKWLALKVWAEQRRLDLIATAEAQGLRSDSPEITAQAKRDAEELRRKEREILGDLEPQYREFEKTNATRQLVARAASTEVLPDVPLTADQVERVTQIIAGNTQRKSNGYVDRFAVNWSGADGPLQQAVSPSQFATLHQVFQQWEIAVQVSHEANARMQQIFAEAKAKLEKR